MATPSSIWFTHGSNESRGWTHECCWDCWWQQHPYVYDENGLAIPRWPTILKGADTVLCCFCGQPNRSGIFVRADPADRDMACAALDQEIAT